MTETVLNGVVAHIDEETAPEISFVSNWADDIQKWGERIQLHRDYVDGNQRLEMTQEVADLLMVDKEEGERFVMNYCRLVMRRRSSRLKVIAIKAVVDPADDIPAAIEAAQKTAETLTRWADRFRRKSRFDGLQIDEHDDVVTSGDSFVMIDAEPLGPATVAEFPDMIMEPAYNGHSGIIPIYDGSQRHMVAVIKIWESGSTAVTDENDNREEVGIFRVNIYYPDRVEKFEMTDGSLKPFTDGGESHIFPSRHPVTQQPMGIPFFHFKNDGRGGRWSGISGIKGAVNANDVLNRSVMNMVLTTNLTAAQIRYIIGAAAPGQKITPGMWVAIGGAGIPNENHMPQVGTFDLGQITPMIEEAQFAIEQIGTVTDTPLPASMGSSAVSGESLKQREVGFVSQIEQMQTKLGNRWEDVIAYAYMVTMAFGTIKPPKGGDGWETIWKPAEVRNDVEVVENAMKIAPFVDKRTVLEEFAKAKAYGWETQDIDNILKRSAEETTASNGTALPPAIGVDSFANTLAEDAVTTDLSEIAAVAAQTGG